MGRWASGQPPPTVLAEDLEGRPPSAWRASRWLEGQAGALPLPQVRNARSPANAAGAQQVLLQTGKADVQQDFAEAVVHRVQDQALGQRAVGREAGRLWLGGTRLGDLHVRGWAAAEGVSGEVKGFGIEELSGGVKEGDACQRSGNEIRKLQGVRQGAKGTLGDSYGAEVEPLHFGWGCEPPGLRGHGESRFAGGGGGGQHLLNGCLKGASVLWGRAELAGRLREPCQGWLGRPWALREEQLGLVQAGRHEVLFPPRPAHLPPLPAFDHQQVGDTAGGGPGLSAGRLLGPGGWGAGRVLPGVG